MPITGSRTRDFGTVGIHLRAGCRLKRLLFKEVRNVLLFFVALFSCGSLLYLCPYYFVALLFIGSLVNFLLNVRPTTDSACETFTCSISYIAEPPQLQEKSSRISRSASHVSHVFRRTENILLREHAPPTGFPRMPRCSYRCRAVARRNRNRSIEFSLGCQDSHAIVFARMRSMPNGPVLRS